MHTHIRRAHARHGGFTLIEILVVLGILAILATLVLVAVNPSRQFKMARDTKRAANVATILNTVSQNIADHSGSFMCQGSAVQIPDVPTEISSDQGGFNLAECVVPDYISALPYDPGDGVSFYNNETHYMTGYKISADPAGRVTVSGVGEVSGGLISAVR